jgi:recombination protein RecA
MKKDKSRKDKEGSENKIEETLKEIKTKFGDDSIMKLGDKPKVDVDAIPTGSLGLEMAGNPCGK